MQKYTIQWNFKKVFIVVEKYNFFPRFTHMIHTQDSSHHVKPISTTEEEEEKKALVNKTFWDYDKLWQVKIMRY